MIKRLVALFLVLLLSIEGFAAVVSDNDGSAFITKAEFDSLKNNFQSQIDQYNTSIDSKIDGAIASYLAGIRVEKASTLNIINSSWEKVTFINPNNGEFLKNEYKIPNISYDWNFVFLMWNGNATGEGGTENGVFNFSRVWSDSTGNVTTTWTKNVDIMNHGEYTKTWSSNETAKRNCVSAVGNSPSTWKLIWLGQALRYVETMNLIRLSRYTKLKGNTSDPWEMNPIDFPFLDLPYSYTFRGECRNLTKILVNGDISDWGNTNIGSYWPISFLWERKPKTETDWVSNTYIINNNNGTHNRDTISASVDIIPINGKSYEFKNIVVYDGSQEIDVSDSTKTKYWNISNDSLIKASTLLDNVTWNNYARFTSIYHPNGNSAQYASNVDLPISYSIDDDTVYPSVGLIGRKILMSIYQDDNTSDISTNTFSVKKVPPKLQEGFQLLAADQGDIITWEPEFETYVHNSDTTYTKNSHEVYIELSTEPFTNKMVSVDKIPMQVNDSSTKVTRAITNSRKCKITFEMPKTSIVYVKVIPAPEDTFTEKGWYVDLLLDKCNTYRVVYK